MLTAPTPRYTAREEVGLKAAQPITPPAWRATRRGSGARAADHRSQLGTSCSNVALPVAMPCSKMRATAGQSAAVIVAMLTPGDRLEAVRGEVLSFAGP